MDHEHANTIAGPVVPVFGELDGRLRDDVDGEFLALCLELLQDARTEMRAPARADAAYRHERNLMDGALRAADQVLRSVWAGFHPRPASRGPFSTL
jgi:hypothetical protein